MKSKLILIAAAIMMMLLLVGCSDDDNAKSSSSESPVSVTVDDGFAEIEEDSVKIDDNSIIADEIACDVFFGPFAPNTYYGVINLDGDNYYYCYDYQYDEEFLGRIIISVEDENKCYIDYNEEFNGSNELLELYKQNDCWFVSDSSLDKYMNENTNNIYRTAQIIAYDLLGSFDDSENDGIIEIDGVSCNQFSFEYEMEDTGSVAIAEDFSAYYVRYVDSEDYIAVAKQFNNWMEYNGITYDTQVPSDNTYKDKAAELCKKHLGEYTDVYFEYSFIYNGHHYFSYSLYNNGELVGVIAVSTDGAPDMVDREKDSTYENL